MSGKVRRDEPDNTPLILTLIIVLIIVGMSVSTCQRREECQALNNYHITTPEELGNIIEAANQGLKKYYEERSRP